MLFLVDEAVETGPRRNGSTLPPSVLVFSSLGPSARLSSHRYHNLPKQFHPTGDQVFKHISLCVCVCGGVHLPTSQRPGKIVVKILGFLIRLT